MSIPSKQYPLLSLTSPPLPPQPLKSELKNSHYPHRITSPPLLRPVPYPHNIPTLPLKTLPGRAAQIGIDLFKVRVGGAHERLSEVVDAVAHVGRVGVVRCFLRRVQGRVVAAAETVL